jgi:hypothetical protein
MLLPPKNMHHKKKHEDLGIKFGKPDTKSSSISVTQKNGHLDHLNSKILGVGCAPRRCHLNHE